MNGRIQSLDQIRGLAVMGIFSANIAAMGLLKAAGTSPTLVGFDTLADRLEWMLNLVLVDGKMRGLFSLLFGASMVLISERALARDREPFAVHLPRLLVLGLFGLAHALFLWWGDILLHYALVGLLALFFVSKPPRFLFAWGTIFLIANALLLGAIAWWSMDSAVQPGDPLGLLSVDPAPPATLAEAAAFHATPFTHFAHQWPGFAAHQLNLSLFLLPETLGFMLLGMALHKAGFLAGDYSQGVYRRWTIGGLGAGALVGTVAAWLAWAHDFTPLFTQMASGGLTFWVKPFMVLGYAALVILACRRPSALGDRLAAVGRAAFTNYLGATIVMTPFLFGFGAGLFDRLGRATLWLAFVPAMWALMLLWSKPWLDRYRYGPLEWLWRVLARATWQPLRLRSA